MMIVIYIVKPNKRAEGSRHMKVSREQAAENRARVIEVAGRLFREKGFDGVGVADIMRGAGLTHGGFYGQFASKDDLAAKACAQTLDRSVARWTRLSEGDDPLAAIVNSYLAPNHRNAPGSGCALSALSGDAVRQPDAVRRVFTQALQSFAGILTRLVPAASRPARRRKALATMAGLVGAVILSRAVNDADFSDEILRAVAKEFAG
jgi:TetR/AcrR family transcriptional regulator, transcriptional repressor for nem operon